MREINLPMTQTFSITINPRTFDLSKAVDMGGGRHAIPLGNIVDPQIGAVVETARKNGGKILYATTSIEQTLENILLKYFMGPFVGHDDRRAMFENEVLKSSALSYRAKKELVTKLINTQALLEGKNKSKLQGHLSTIMEWRNAFAHGKIQHDTPKGCFISYYSGGTKKIMLDDKYWNDVENTFKECVELLKEAEQQLERKQQAK
ncbi:MAG TPA: hypothetical protein VFM25_10265 [Verrucomicrobiae bacterium]|nr:hypothetical protein [Verrucomicrobiae bacterium]